MRVDNEFVTQLVESLEYVLITTKVHYGKLLMIRNSTISGSFWDYPDTSKIKNAELH